MKILFFLFVFIFFSAGSKAEPKAEQQNEAVSYLKKNIIKSLSLKKVKLKSCWEPSLNTEENQDMIDFSQRWYELRLSNSPEAAVSNSYQHSAEERINSSTLAYSLPYREHTRFSVILQESRYKLDLEGSEHEQASLTSLNLIMYNEFRQNWRSWLGILPYSGSAARGLGVWTRLEWTNKRNLIFGLEGAGWQPWLENTLAVANDARQHYVHSYLQLMLNKKISLFLEKWFYYYSVGSKADNGAQYAGKGSAEQLRLNYQILNIPGRVMNTGFLTPDVLADDSLSTELSLYVALRKEKTELASDFGLIPVSPHTRDTRIGTEGQIALSKHLGLAFNAYIGEDTKREIKWKKLYGLNTRFVFVPKGRFRLWFETGLDSENESGVTSGITYRLSLGGNCNF